MEQRGCGLGCIIAGLGLLLSCALLPYLISSIYSIVSALLQVPTPSTWLWGDWLNTIVDSSNPLYMVLAEGPICCVGTITLLFVILGAVLVISSVGPTDEYEYEYDDEYGDEYYYDEDYESQGEPTSWQDDEG